MRVLELFAGIGGESLALKAAGFKTVGYCEKEPWSQAVLMSNMARGRLDEAPIFPDVRHLKGSDVGKVDMIAGGFPCLGLSSIGKKRGLYGDARSNLVRHVYRLVDELNPTYVFLENTPHIIRDKSFPDLLKQFTRRNYKVAFVVSTASENGASHMRARWFMLAQKRGARPLRVSSKNLTKLRALFRQKVPRKILPREEASASKTCFSFGNSVVPAQALSALLKLSLAIKQPTEVMAATSLSALDRSVPTVVDGGGLLQEPETDKPDTSCRGAGFTVSPPKSVGKSVNPILRETFKSSCMPTARTGANCCLGGRSMTSRSSRDPANFLLSSKEMFSDGKVPSDAERARLAIAPEFWAVSFGFPRNWISHALSTFAP